MISSSFAFRKVSLIMARKVAFSAPPPFIISSPCLRQSPRALHRSLYVQLRSSRCFVASHSHSFECCRVARPQETLSMKVDSTDIGCASLIAGTMVGAGVLALPAVSAPSGFGPATVALIFVWGYMVASAMLGAEVAVHASCALGRPSGVSLLSQARLTLGPIGAALSSCSYVYVEVPYVSFLPSVSRFSLKALTNVFPACWTDSCILLS